MKRERHNNWDLFIRGKREDIVPHTIDANSALLIGFLCLLFGSAVTLFFRWFSSKSKQVNEDSIKFWRVQDWLWLLAFLIYAQIFTVLYKDWVMSVVSYVSTFVSIALGAVAIYISVREATKGDNVKDQINVMLGELREKVTQMDTKLNSFDPREFNKVKDNKIDELSEEVKEDIIQKFSDKETISKEEVLDIFKKVTGELKTSLTITDDKNIGSENKFVVNTYIDGVVAVFDADQKFNATDIQMKMLEIHGIPLSVDYIEDRLYRLSVFGFIKSELRSPGYYKRTSLFAK